MSANLIIRSLLTDPTITALVGTRNAQSQLPDSVTFPALVYTFVSDNPRPNLAATGSQLMEVRVQFNPLAATMAEVDAIHATLRTLLDFKHHVTIAGKLVTSIRRLPSSPVASKDPDRGIWTSPADYMLTYYE